MRWLTAGLLLASASPILANELTSGELRVASIATQEHRIVPIDTSTSTNQTLRFAQGERITNVSLSDPSAYWIAVSPSSDSLVLRASSARSLALMNVTTDQGDYAFQLVSSAEGLVPAVFTVGTMAQAALSSSESEPTESTRTDTLRHWTIKGNNLIRPLSVKDDGARTYVEWANDQPLPATFAFDPAGGEQTVDGHMRGGLFTIDRVLTRLVFRLDEAQASAEPKQVRRRRNERD